MNVTAGPELPLAAKPASVVAATNLSQSVKPFFWGWAESEEGNMSMMILKLPGWTEMGFSCRGLERDGTVFSA